MSVGLMFIPDCCKDQKMGHEAVNNYSHALTFVPECYKKQIICKEAVNDSRSAIQLVL